MTSAANPGGGTVPIGLPSGSRVAAKVVLQDIRLSEARLEVLRSPADRQIDVEVDINLRTGWELVDGGLNVAVGIWVRLLPLGDERGSEDDESIMSVVVEETVEYSLPDGLDPDDEEISGFVEQSAVLTAWPYLRETVQSLAGRAGIPNLTLPIHKVSLPTPPEPEAATTRAAARRAPAKKATRKASAGKTTAKKPSVEKSAAETTRSATSNAGRERTSAKRGSR